MSLTVILEWYKTLQPGAKAKLSLHDLHRLSKALPSEARTPQSEAKPSAGTPATDELNPPPPNLEGK